LWFNTAVLTATSHLEELTRELDVLPQHASSADGLMTAITKLLHDKLPTYNWVGFYMLEKGAVPPMLVLGPFQGAPTPHTRIPLHQGICGAAASSGQTVIVDDVHADPRYLSCSLETKSEIVVPVFVKGQVVGELDIDSHTAAAFGPADHQLCQRAASILGSWLERHGST
jgi:GAF domain-containing protein